MMEMKMRAGVGKRLMENDWGQTYKVIQMTLQRDVW